jgi:biopolymer transport protein ExbB
MRIQITTARRIAAAIALATGLFTAHSSATSATASAQAKLDQSIAELSSARALIAAEREPLAAEMRRLENEVLELRRSRERAQRLVDNQGVDLSALEAQVKAYDDEASYVLNLLNDYFNRANASLSVAEVASFQQPFVGALNAGSDAAKPIPDRLAAMIGAVDTTIDRNVALAGGYRFAGQAVLPTGQLATGQFAIIGPVTYFASADAKHGGIILRGAGDSPAVVEFDSKAVQPIHAFVSSGSGSLPVDTTMGRALAIATADETLVEHFLKGGLWMYPIAFFAVFATLIAILKVVQITGTKDLPKGELESLLAMVRDDKATDALHRVKELEGPAARMLEQGLLNISYSKELMEEFLFEIILTEKPRLERGIPFIMLSASVAPLLGLLGTVTGMIETFKLLTLFGTGDAKSLSSGISQALITTEFGLVAAIPSLILAAIVGRMAAAKLASLEKLLLAFSNGVAAAKEQARSAA